MATLSFPQLLQKMIDTGSSDLHLQTGRVPALRTPSGELLPVPDTDVLTHEDIIAVMSHVGALKDADDQLRKLLHVEHVYQAEDYRFRCAFYETAQGLAGVMRLLPNAIPTREQLGLPAVVDQLVLQHEGLILIAGSNGSGKTTTLNYLLDRINKSRYGKIVTIEDPIEMMYEEDKCRIQQLELGTHIASMRDAGRYLFREDVDVVAIGELRDTDSFAAAVNLAVTGHLVVATIHAADVESALQRLIQSFPAHEQEVVRTSVALSLSAVIAQRLVPGSDGGRRHLATEVLLRTQPLTHHILENNLLNIRYLIESGAEQGMQTFDRSYGKLLEEGSITKQQYLRYTGQL